MSKESRVGAYPFPFQTQSQAYWINAVRLPLEPELTGPTFTEDPELKQVTVVLGIAFTFPVNSLKDKLGVPIEMGGFVPVRLHLENGKLYADTTVLDLQGNAVIEVQNNKFKIHPIAWDRNSNDMALEVVDARGRPVFQMIYERPNRIRLTGMFVGGRSQSLLADNDGGFTINPSPEQIEDFKLKPIFMYPAWKYAGQLSN